MEVTHGVVLFVGSGSTNILGKCHFFPCKVFGKNRLGTRYTARKLTAETCKAGYLAAALSVICQQTCLEGLSQVLASLLLHSMLLNNKPYRLHWSQLSLRVEITQNIK